MAFTEPMECRLGEHQRLRRVEGHDRCRRGIGACSRSIESSPNQSPGPSTLRVAISPSGVETITARCPALTRCTESERSPSWKTISPLLNERLLAASSTARCFVRVK